ncbi:MAG TPA: DUF6265 family protein [Panacibacter sp.]|nr:DUF6265 family protein [Panacibacter sp.]
MYKIFLLAGMLMLCNSAPAQNDVFKKLNAFEGKWKMQTKKGEYLYESWEKINDSYLQSKSFLIKLNGDTMQMETVTLTQINEDIFYTSSVPGQNDGKGIAFRLTGFANNTFTFENAEHDFPKRIVYQFTGDGSLHAWIDGGKDAADKRNDYHYKKVAL